MWLLNTRTALLEKFISPEAVSESTRNDRKPGYAIMSHCWGEQEQTFQDTEAIKLQNHHDPRTYASEKIKNFCIVAEQLGYQWGWADTCCIDKTSSSDLSEAIDSMFRYYSLSAVCIVFLHDVPTNCKLPKKDSEFRRSRWHKRGWTLQELIAPQNKVVFYSQDWKELATRAETASLLQEITGIPEDVLWGRKQVTEMSVAARMSWAAQRETTREEDEAYCLLGILKVNMSIRYGEGRHAFYRLQEELIKRSTDSSIFAWGKAMDMADLHKLKWEDIQHQGAFSPNHDHKAEPFILAPTPSCFRNGSMVSWTPSVSLGDTGCSFDISSFLNLEITVHGIRGRFPVVELKAQRLLVAYIACSQEGHQVGLILAVCNNAEATSPSGPIYDASFVRSQAEGVTRLALLTRRDHEDRFQDKLRFEWRELYIRMCPSFGENIVIPEKENSQEVERARWGKRLSGYMVVILGILHLMYSSSYGFLSGLYLGTGRRSQR